MYFATVFGVFGKGNISGGFRRNPVLKLNTGNKYSFYYGIKPDLLIFACCRA